MSMNRGFGRISAALAATAKYRVLTEQELLNSDWRVDQARIAIEKNAHRMYQILRAAIRVNGLHKAGSRALRNEFEFHRGPAHLRARR